MQDPTTPTPDHRKSSEEHSTLFAHLVIQQTNMAMMLMGRVAHPETGETTRDLDAARLFIDQLEMLEVKTKGNLTREESGLLAQSLMALRMAFVEAVESPAPSPAASGTTASAAPPASEATAKKDAPSAEDDEHRKKFSKKY